MADLCPPATILVICSKQVSCLLRCILVLSNLPWLPKERKTVATVSGTWKGKTVEEDGGWWDSVESQCLRGNGMFAVERVRTITLKRNAFFFFGVIRLKIDLIRKVQIKRWMLRWMSVSALCLGGSGGGAKRQRRVRCERWCLSVDWYYWSSMIYSNGISWVCFDLKEFDF